MIYFIFGLQSASIKARIKKIVKQSLEFVDEIKDSDLYIMISNKLKELDKEKDKVVEKKDKTKYGFGNLLNILFNRKREYDPKNLSLVCSQFVDVIFKLANIDVLTTQSLNYEDYRKSCKTVLSC